MIIIKTIMDLEYYLSLKACMTTIALARDVHILGDADIWKTALPHLIELYFREMVVFTPC